MPDGNQTPLKVQHYRDRSPTVPAPAMVVGICGGTLGHGVGKTLAAKSVADRLGFLRIGLTDHVRRVASATFSREPTLRDMDIICRGGRKVTQDYWLNLSLRCAFPDSMPCDRGVVLDDLWFANEAEFVQDAGGLVILVRKAGVPEDIDSFSPDVTVENTGDEAAFTGSVVDAVRKHFGMVPGPEPSV